MSSPLRYLEYNGELYTFQQLYEISGINIKTLRTRLHDHPDISFEELIGPSKRIPPNSIKETINGVEKTLSDWAKEAHLSYDTLLSRWKRGVRGSALLINPRYRQRTAFGAGKRPVLSPDNIEWILDTRKYRKGQPDEWEIACELIGANSSWAGWLKREMEERGYIQT